MSDGYHDVLNALPWLIGATGALLTIATVLGVAALLMRTIWRGPGNVVAWRLRALWWVLVRKDDDLR